MLNFIGTYECKVDSKGRVTLPVAILKQLESVITESFIIKRSIFQTCLEIHPISKWNEIMKNMNNLNRFVKKNNDFIRIFTAGVKLVELDANYRIQVSKDLMQFAKLEKEIVLSSSIGMIEVWDKSKYEDMVNPNHVDFAILAEEIMGKNENGNSIS